VTLGADTAAGLVEEFMPAGNLLYERVHFAMGFLYCLLGTNTAAGLVEEFMPTRNLLYERVHFAMGFLYCV